MSGNGQRISIVPDWAAGEFYKSTVISRRFRCPACGVTKASDEPEMEPGFRLTAEAADALIRLAIEGSITEAAQKARTDKGTVSRLVKARYSTYLAKTTRPTVAFINEVNERVFCVSDAACGSAIAYFAKSEEQQMINWLSVPDPLVILTDANCLARVINWKGDFVVSLAGCCFTDMIKPTINQSATRMASHLKIPKNLRGTIADLLINDFIAASSLPSDVHHEIFRAGAPARHFMRLRDNLNQIQFATSISEGTRSVDGWLSNIAGAWLDIFEPTISILERYRSYLFSHPACISCNPTASRPLGTSAAMLTLHQSLE